MPTTILSFLFISQAYVKKIKKDQGNTHFTIQTTITNELKIDQSVAHNGVCLTVVEIFDDNYVVTAIKETLDKTNLDKLSVNEEVNIERAMKLGDRLDGHIVQGHVDQIAVCTEILLKMMEVGFLLFLTILMLIILLLRKVL